MISENLIRKFDSRKINFLISVCGVFGSLYFSEVLKYLPCFLCWYQRIALYPLALIYAIALWSDDHAHRKYTFTFIVLGFATALYHNLLYYGVIEQAIVPCSEGGVSCTSRQLELFGFLTIPLLSIISFSMMGLMEIINLRIICKRGRA